MMTMIRFLLLVLCFDLLLSNDNNIILTHALLASNVNTRHPPRSSSSSSSSISASPPSSSSPSSSSSSSSFLHIDAESLTGLLSSSERYAQALGLTVEEVATAKERHDRASEELHRQLHSFSTDNNNNNNNTMTGEEKHSLICQNRLEYGRHPFCCPNCWSYTPVCLCGLVQERNNENRSTNDNNNNEHGHTNDDDNENNYKRSLPEGIEKVLVWTHHKEWGLTSNTGCLLPLTLQNTQMLMKGWPKHDRILDEYILNDKDYLTVVLWPDQNNSNDDDDDQQQQQQQDVLDGTEHSSSLKKNNDNHDNRRIRTISLKDVQTEMKSGNRRLVLIAVDGTWRNARRMVARLPRSVPRLDLPMDVVFSEQQATTSSSSSSSSSSDDTSSIGTKAATTTTTKSILAPLRFKKGPVTTGGNGDQKNDNVGERQVCTSEAVAGALMQLGLPRQDGVHVLDITRIKVDLIRRYRGIRV